MLHLLLRRRIVRILIQPALRSAIVGISVAYSSLVLHNKAKVTKIRQGRKEGFSCFYTGKTLSIEGVRLKSVMCDR